MNLNRPTPALFAPAEAAPGSDEAAVIARLEPFFQLGMLDSLELFVVARLGKRVGMLDPEVLLALALAVRAPQRGHICVDLNDAELQRLLPHNSDPSAEPPDLSALSLPVDGWAAKVASCIRLVRGPDDDRLTPFVLEGQWLYTDRYWSYQTELKTRLLAMAAQTTQVAVAPEDHALLSSGLDFLFRPPHKEGAWPDEPADSINRQRVAGAVALTRQLAVITGGPGMGKTWTVRNLLALLWLRHRARFERGEVETKDPAVALAAPTGKAAARMKEALRSKLSEEFLPAIGRFLTDETQKQEIMTFIQEAETRTLHRLLGWQSKNPTRFRHHANNPLPYDVVVVDEASMVDFAMMSKLASAVSGRGTGGEPTRLLLLGDRYQLASVEAGTVLADICGQTDAAALRFTKAGAAVLASYPKLDLLAAPPEARVELVEGPAFRDAVVQFDRTYRFADDSGIGAFAKACLAVPFDPKVASGILAQGGDVTLIEPNDDGRLTAAVQTTIVDGFRPYLQMLKRGQDDKDLYPTEAVFHRRVLETFDRFRVLCAHRAGRTGVQGLNEATIALLKHHELIDTKRTWWMGRPVLVRRNDYNVRRSSGGKGLYNGDIGLLVRATIGGKRQYVVAFAGIDALPPANKDGSFPTLDPKSLEDKRIVEYLMPSRLPSHATAFCMTIHKSQGSEFDHVLVVLPSRQSGILTRELIYTGVTRAKRKMTMVGSTGVLEAALDETVQRASGLRRALWGSD